MKTPYFSVIIPCFNSFFYVDTAIQSVLNQSFKGVELILVNDGSTDETLSVFSKYGHDDRVTIINKKNGGYPSAINAGLGVASGKYIIMLGSDDRLFEGILQTVYDRSKTSNPDIVFFQSVMYCDGVRRGLDPLSNYKGEKDLRDVSFNDCCSLLPEHSLLFFERDTSRCFKKSLIGDLRYFGHTGIDGDAVFSLLVERRCTSFLFLTAEGYCWTLRNDSVSGRTQNFDTLRDRLFCWTQYFRYLCRHNMILTVREQRIALHLSQFIDLLFDSAGPLFKKLATLFGVSKVIRLLAKKNRINLDDYPNIRSPLSWFCKRHVFPR